MKKSFLFGSLIFILFCKFAINAQIFFGDREIINFTPEKVQKEVTWSTGFSLSENGLAAISLPANQSRDIWIQTHAFPIEMSWRPPAWANFKVYFEGSINDRDAKFPTDPQVFLRFSCDKEHWSTWYWLKPSDDKTEKGLKIYSENLSLPEASREKYNFLMREWWKTSPAWSSDETAFCEWLIKKEPDFFANEFPFIGYVQVRIEKAAVNNSQSITSLTVESNSAVGGLSSPPHDKTRIRKNTGDKWFFTGS